MLITTGLCRFLSNTFMPVSCPFILIQFKSSNFTPRSPETYDYHCSLLLGPLASTHSTTYGTTGSSVLNDISHFHVVTQLPQDIMHVLLEGVVPYEVRLMLKTFITEDELLTLDMLNERISYFCYSSSEAADKPSAFTIHSFTSLRQSGMNSNMSKHLSSTFVLDLHLNSLF